MLVIYRQPMILVNFLFREEGEKRYEGYKIYFQVVESLS